MKLKIYLSDGEDGYIVAECPALPGCVSQGRNREEALANIREAIEGWLEIANEKFSESVTRGQVSEVEVEV